MTTENNNQENITSENSEENKSEAPAVEEKAETAAVTESKPADVPSSVTESKPADLPSADVPPAYVRKPASPADRRPDSNQGPRREHSGGDRYQKRDSSQRFSKFRRKVCYYCGNKDAVIDYKDGDALDRFITDRGKILPRRVTGVCARHQRGLANAIKKARLIALVPFLEK